LTHGAAGIAYALLQLSQLTGDLRFQHAAEDAISFETSVYCERSRNWPDFRVSPGRQGYHNMVGWCNGAAGIGLARLGGLNILDTPGIRADIANALETTRQSLAGSSDDLCCGNFGRLELLIEAADQLGELDLLNEARGQGSRIVGKAAGTGRFGLLASAPGVGGSLSLFQGTAGIGYELLRLAAPSEVPNVLLWK
jgi:lantibiotic modifying enzyme